MNASSRGAVLVESALTLLMLLTVIYGAVQLGIAGLQQLSVDGAAFTAAHQMSLLGNNPQGYLDPVKLTQQVYPSLQAPNVVLPEPVIGQPPAFGDSSVSKALGLYDAGASGARHGGVSMILPAQTIATVGRNSLPSILLDAVTELSVSAIAIDPAFRLINGHGDVSGSTFGTAAAFATASDPINNGNNAPPYFVGFNYMQQCRFQETPWTVCPSEFFAGLGSAEYLDQSNWSRETNGVIPSPTAVFWETLLHEDKFADVATALASSTSDTSDASILDPTQNADVACVYSFDNDNLGSYAVGSKTIGAYPLYPAGNPACPMP